MPASLILVPCKGCHHEFRVPGSLSGREVTCPYCAKAVSVPITARFEKDPLVDKELGGCRLARRLGAGGLGAVYQALHLATGHQVAIKLLGTKFNDDLEAVHRFQREAELAMRIHHPNVIAIYEQGFDRKVHYQVMELVEGGSLAGLIADQGRLRWQEACRIIRSLTEALAAVRDRGIIHRDIKPANVLLTADGQPKLADLGMGKQIEGAEDPTQLTMEGMAMGTANYMPPEQIRDSASASYPADVYALGATFYHAVVGKPPFVGRSPIEVMRAVLERDPVPPKDLVSDLPQGINDLIMEMLAKDPEDRPADAVALIQEIDLALQSPACARERRRRARERKRRRRTLVLVLAMAVLVLAAAVVAVLLCH